MEMIVCHQMEVAEFFEQSNWLLNDLRPLW
jgi:hypothetical protein